MIRGFRKLVDIPVEDVERLAAVGRQLAARPPEFPGISHLDHIWTAAGPQRDQKVWRIYVHIRDLAIARAEMARIKVPPAPQGKVVTIS